MSCEERRELIAASLDGGLAPEERADLEAHLAGCAACAALAAELRALRGAAAGLLEDAGPGDWAALERALRSRDAGSGRSRDASSGRSRPRWRWLGLAAAAVLLAALSVVLVLAGRGGGEAGRARLELARLEAQQERTVAALQQLVSRRRAGWDPRLQDAFARGAAQVEAALEDCRRALRRDPTDLALRASLLEAYQRKVELLRIFSGLDEEGTR